MKTKRKTVIVVALAAMAGIATLTSARQAPKPDGWSKIQQTMTRTEVYQLLGKPNSEPSAPSSTKTGAEWKHSTLLGGRALKLSFDSTDRVTAIANEAAVWPFNLFL